MDQAIAQADPVEDTGRSGDTEPRASVDAGPSLVRRDRTPPKSGDTPVAPDLREPISASGDPEARAAVNPAAAAELARRGQVALREGHISKAETAFHAALGHDRRNVSALSGLGEVYFQKQAYEKSIEFFERATRASPRSATHRISLGDVYFKVLRYDDALAQYEQAQALGSERASQRIDRLRAKIGRGSTP
jgi:tetratricopeptide (TPR) repeat protein